MKKTDNMDETEHDLHNVLNTMISTSGNGVFIT
jgi:hypothetical protein